MLAPSVAPATKVVCLTQIVNPDELKDDDDYEDIVEDMRTECGKFGKYFKLPFHISLMKFTFSLVNNSFSFCMCSFYNLLNALFWLKEKAAYMQKTRNMP